MSCNENNRPLYTCNSFQAITPEKCLAKARVNSLCMNCLYQRTSLAIANPHKNVKSAEASPIPCCILRRSRQSPNSFPRPEETHCLEKTPKVNNHFSNGRKRGILLMTCQVMIREPNGSLIQDRALLDYGSEATFITERLAQ